jgi:hypothetical protein
MYFTRFGYFIIFSIIAVAVGAVVLVVYPFGDDDDGGGSVANPTATIAIRTTPLPTAAAPSLTFDQVVNFAEFGAVVDIRVTGGGIIVNLRPDFDVSGLNTTSHTFTTTLPPGTNSLEAALQAEGIEVNGPTGVPVIRQ